MKIARLPRQAEQCVAAATGVSLSNFLLMVVPFAAGGSTCFVRAIKCVAKDVYRPKFRIIAARIEHSPATDSSPP